VELRFCINFVPTDCYSGRIFTRFFTCRFDPAGQQRSFSVLFFIALSAERKVQNEMVKWF